MWRSGFTTINRAHIVWALLLVLGTSVHATTPSDLIYDYYFGQNGITGSIHSDLKDQVTRAHELFYAGKTKQAIDISNKLAARFPNNPKAQALAGIYNAVAYLRDKHESKPDKQIENQIIDYFQRAIRLDPHNKDLMAAYASLLSQLDRHVEAIGRFEKLFSNASFRTHDKYRYGVTNYGLSLTKIGRSERAMREYVKSIEATDYDPRLCRAYVGVLSGAGKESEMHMFVEEYFKRKGFSEDIKYVECYETVALKDYERAIECYQSLIAHESSRPKYKEAAYIEIAEILQYLSKDIEALQIIQRGIKDLPTSAKLRSKEKMLKGMQSRDLFK